MFNYYLRCSVSTVCYPRRPHSVGHGRYLRVRVVDLHLDQSRLSLAIFGYKTWGHPGDNHQEFSRGTPRRQFEEDVGSHDLGQG